MKDVSKMLFRASSVGHLLTDAKASTITAKQLQTIAELEAKDSLTKKQSEELERLKAKRDAPEELSAGAKTYVRKCWREFIYDMEEPVETDVLMKGKLCEQDSLALLDIVCPVKGFRVKNKIRKTDNFFTGECDVFLELDEELEDVKSSFTLKSFDDVDSPSKIYVAQAQVYMHLWGVKKYRLRYCLVDTPEEIVENLIHKMSYKFLGGVNNPDFLKAEAQIRKAHSVSHIPEEDRVKTFLIDYDQSFIDKLKKRVGMAREYAKTLSLSRPPVQVKLAP